MKATVADLRYKMNDVLKGSTKVSIIRMGNPKRICKSCWILR